MTDAQQLAAVWAFGVPVVAVAIGYGNRRLDGDVSVALAITWPLFVPLALGAACLMLCEELGDWLGERWP